MSRRAAVRPVSVFESGAILQYLAEKAGKFLPKDLRGKYEVLQWVNWQMGGLGPMAGQANHFNMYAPQFNPPEQLRYGQDRYSNEVNRLFGVLNKRLGDRPFVAGDFSIADMAIWPWVVGFKNFGQKLEDFANSQEMVRGDDGQASGGGEGQGGRRSSCVPDARHQHRRAAQDPVRPDGIGGSNLDAMSAMAMLT